jgi:uncharacterized protein
MAIALFLANNPLLSLGRVAEVGYDPHIRHLIEQVLFTEPGERVNRPNFGSGLRQLIFAPNSSELAAAVQLLVQGSLEQWLGDLILLEAVEVENMDSQLTVTVQFMTTAGLFASKDNSQQWEPVISWESISRTLEAQEIQTLAQSAERTFLGTANSR